MKSVSAGGIDPRASVVVTVAGLSYGSLLRGMDQAMEEYRRGDPEAALQQYEKIDERLRSVGALRVIPMGGLGAIGLQEFPSGGKVVEEIVHFDGRALGRRGLDL